MDWQAEENRLQKAADCAQEILEGLRLLSCPVSPEALIEREPSLEAIGGDLGDACDGQLEYHPDHNVFVLLYNDRYDKRAPPGRHHPRTRFSIAHELAHFYLDEHNEWLRRVHSTHPSHAEFTSDNPIEREADAFAASLLMPEKLLRPRFNWQEPSVSVLEDLAHAFDTSLVTTAIRSAKLSDYPCAIAGIRDGAVAWQFLSRRLIDERCFPAPRGPLRSDTAIQQWQRFPTGEKTTASGWASDWFQIYDADRQRLPVEEHFLPAPVMDTLIVLLYVPEEELDQDDD